jgi:hypothetical protein
LQECQDRDYKALLKVRHEENVRKVDAAFDLLVEWMRNRGPQGDVMEETR